MKIVSRDYSIGKSTVETQNQTASNALLPKAYAKNQTISNNNLISSGVNTIANAASTVINTLDEINDIKTNEDTALYEMNNLATYTQSLTNSANASYKNWTIDEATGARIPSDDFIQIRNAAIENINNSSMTSDAKKYEVEKFVSVYDNIYGKFANESTAWHADMIHQQQSDTLNGLIQASASSAEAVRTGTGTYKDLFKSENAIKNYMLTEMGYQGDALDYAYKAAIKQRDFDASVSEILGIAKKDGEGAAIAANSSLLDKGAIDYDKWADTNGKISKTSSAINTQVKEQGKQDATVAIEKGMMAGIVKKVGIRKLEEEGYSDTYIDSYSYAFDEAQKKAINEKYKDFSSNLDNCVSVSDVEAIKKDIEFDKASFSGAAQETYNSMITLANDKESKIQKATYNKILEDNNYQYELYKNNLISTEQYLSLCSNQMKLAAGDEKTQTAIMENMRKCLGTLPDNLNEMAKASHVDAENIAKNMFKKQRNNGDYTEYTDCIQGYTLALDDFLRDKPNATQLDVDNFLAKYMKSWKDRDIMKIGSVFEFTDVSAGFSNNKGDPVSIKKSITDLWNMGGLVWWGAKGNGEYGINGCNSQTIQDFDKVSQVSADIIQTTLGDKYLVGGNKLPVCVGLKQDRNGWDVPIPMLMNEAGNKVSWIDQNMNVITCDCKYDNGSLVVLNDTVTIKKANTQYIDDKNKHWAGAVAIAAGGDEAEFVKYMGQGVQSGIISQEENVNAMKKYSESNFQKVKNTTPEITDEWVNSLEGMDTMTALYKLNDAVENGIIDEKKAERLRQKVKSNGR